MDAKKIILKTFLSPGDLCTLSAAVESLHVTYPGRFLTDVRTACDDLFKHNPRITPLQEEEAEIIDMHYTDLVNASDQVPNVFLRGYCADLGKKLGVPLELTVNRPCLYLSDFERNTKPICSEVRGVPLEYWIISAGTKSDFTLKQWPIEYFQEVVDRFKDKIAFVQIGSEEHDHPHLKGVINLVGQTDTRHLLRLVYHSMGGLGPITFLQHVCAAFEKPYVALVGGREPVIWTQYPIQTTLHTIGKLSCCKTHACWRSRVVPLKDGSEQDKSLCEKPMLDFQRPVGKCMAIIRPNDVYRAIESYYDADASGSELLASLSVPSVAPRNSETSLEQKLLPELAAYSDWGFETQIVPAPRDRDWMDSFDNGFSYHCLPMVMANQAGWFLLASHAIVATWNGGAKAHDLTVEVIGEPEHVQAVSHVGGGILTWLVPYVFRTSPGWNLLCRGPSNLTKDGIVSLEGLVETDWTFASFSANWRFTRPGVCRFEVGEPIAMLVPQRRADLEAIQTRMLALTENTELKSGYDQWVESRHDFLQALRQGDKPGQRFQLHYRRGCTNDGVFYPGHQRSLHLGRFQAPDTSSPRPDSIA